jgi:hypothetical protein
MIACVVRTLTRKLFFSTVHALSFKGKKDLKNTLTFSSLLWQQNKNKCSIKIEIMQSRI